MQTLHKEIEATLEKIASREKYVNTQFESQIDQFKGLSDALSNLKQKHTVGNTNVDQLANELSRISEELETVKTRMDDIGNGMTDSKPLVNIKQGFARLKNEVKQLDLRTGVIQHTLLTAKMKNKVNGMAGGDRFGGLGNAQVYSVVLTM